MDRRARPLGSGRVWLGAHSVDQQCGVVRGNGMDQSGNAGSGLLSSWGKKCDLLTHLAQFGLGMQLRVQQGLNPLQCRLEELGRMVESR